MSVFTDYPALKDTVDTGVKQLGRLDVVLANPGMTTAGFTWEIDPAQWRTTIENNLTGAFFTAKATVPTLMERGTGGAVIFTSSVAGTRGLPLIAIMSPLNTV